MQKGIVQVLSLVKRHTTILSRLAVEDGIDGHERAAKDGTANQQLAEASAAGGGLLRGLLVV